MYSEKSHSFNADGCQDVIAREKRFAEMQEASAKPLQIRS